MPYIAQDNRDYLDGFMERLLLEIQDQGISEGELNYLLTKLLLAWLGEANYRAYNSAIGVLECAKQELYRRAISPYEDRKREENGEVYGRA